MLESKVYSQTPLFYSCINILFNTLLELQSKRQRLHRLAQEFLSERAVSDYFRDEADWDLWCSNNSSTELKHASSRSLFQKERNSTPQLFPEEHSFSRRSPPFRSNTYSIHAVESSPSYTQTLREPTRTESSFLPQSRPQHSTREAGSRATASNYSAEKTPVFSYASLNTSASEHSATQTTPQPPPVALILCHSRKVKPHNSLRT